jgi:hypothetical protein
MSKNVLPLCDGSTEPRSVVTHDVFSVVNGVRYDSQIEITRVYGTLSQVVVDGAITLNIGQTLNVQKLLCGLPVSTPCCSPNCEASSCDCKSRN